MRAIRCALAAVLAAGIVTMVAAQPGGQRGGGGVGDVNTLVFTNAALQEEIKVTAAQKEKLKPTADKYTELNKKRADMAKAGKDGFDKDKFAEMQEEGKKLAEDGKKVFDDVFTADQKKRLKQIGLQAMSVGVFAEPVEAKGKGGFGGTSEAAKATMKEVGETLKLTDAQKSKVKGIMEEYTKDARAIRTDVFGEKGGKGAQDPEKQKDFTAKSAKLSTEVMGKIADALDDTQKTAWKGMVGEPFDMAKLRPMRKD